MSATPGPGFRATPSIPGRVCNYVVADRLKQPLFDRSRLFQVSLLAHNNASRDTASETIYVRDAVTGLEITGSGSKDVSIVTAQCFAKCPLF